MTPSKTMRPYTRKLIYINKEFQRAFITRFCILAGVGAVVTMGIIYWLAMNSTTVAIHDGRVAVHTTAEYLLPLMFQTLALEAIIGGIGTVALTMIISFRIAGPLYKLKTIFRSLSRGDLSTHIKFRKDDEFKDLAVAYNEAIDKLNNKVKSLKNLSTVEEIKKELDNFKTT